MRCTHEEMLVMELCFKCKAGTLTVGSCGEVAADRRAALSIMLAAICAAER